MNVFILTDAIEPCPSESYTFRGAAGRVNWPKSAEINVGIGGAWNLFWRLGYHPVTVQTSHLPLPEAGLPPLALAR